MGRYKGSGQGSIISTKAPFKNVSVDVLTSKVCSRCKVDKSTDEFYPTIYGKGQRTKVCKSCDRQLYRLRVKAKKAQQERIKAGMTETLDAKTSG